MRIMNDRLMIIANEDDGFRKTTVWTIEMTKVIKSDYQEDYSVGQLVWSACMVSPMI